MPINQVEPAVRNAGAETRCEVISNTRLAAHAPIGMVTSIGWNGCPYGPAIVALIGCLPRSEVACTASTSPHYTSKCWRYRGGQSRPVQVLTQPPGFTCARRR